MKKLISFVSVLLLCSQAVLAQKLQQVLPAEVGFDEVRLQNADKAIERAIAEKQTQVLFYV